MLGVAVLTVVIQLGDELAGIAAAVAPCSGRGQNSDGGIGQLVAEVEVPEVGVGTETEVVGHGVVVGAEVLEGVAWQLFGTSELAPDLP